MLIFETVSPANSQALYVEPSTPTWPIIFKITSYHKLPSANTIAISVEPIPVENAPKAP